MRYAALRRFGAGALLTCAILLPPASSRAADVQGTPSFSADALSLLSPAGRPIVTVRVSVPQSELVFAKTEGQFRAACEVTIVVRPKKGERRSVTRTLRAVSAGYRDARRDSLKLTTSETFDVVPGDHTVEVTVRDLDSGSKSRVKMTLKIENLRARDGTLSPLTLGRLPEGVPVEDAKASDVLPNPSRVFGARDPFTVIAGEIYRGEGDDAARESTWTLSYKITDDDGQLRLRGTRTVRRGGIVTPFLLAPNLAWLSMGAYKLEVKTVGKALPRTISFAVDESLVDLEHDYERLVAMISYGATDRELDSLRSADTVAERQLLWERFWERRNPEPGTGRNIYKTQYFDRVRYANDNYSTGGEEGWRSDRGRIYIKFGAPDQVDEQQMTAFHPAYLLWRYYQPSALFVFADKEGFGRYYLVNATRRE